MNIDFVIGIILIIICINIFIIIICFIIIISTCFWQLIVRHEACSSVGKRYLGILVLLGTTLKMRSPYTSKFVTYSY